MRARSTAASVWPAPLEHAAVGVAQREDVGWAVQVGRPQAGSIQGLVVAARSAAEMPVLVPWRKSTLTVNAVRWASVLWLTISGMSSSPRRSPVIGTQMRPEVAHEEGDLLGGGVPRPP